jgi:hypothetical protein
MVKKYTLFNNIRVGEIIADSINLEPHNVIPKIHDVINGANATEVYIVEEFKGAPAAALPAAGAVNNGYYFQTTGDNKLYFGENSAWEEVAVENGDRYFLFNDSVNATGSIYKVTTAAGTVGAASAEAISNTNDTIALNNRDKKAYEITVALAGNTAFNAAPTAKSAVIETYSYAGVRKTVAGRTNIHLYRLGSDGFTEKESTLKKLDRVTVIDLGGTYFESHLLADPVASTLTLNGAAAASTNKNSVELSNFISGDINGNAATATKLAASKTIGGVAFDGSANIDLPGVNVDGSQNTSGNAATATALATSENTTAITAANQNIAITDGNYLSAITGAAGQSINLTGTAVGQLVIVKEVGGAQPLSVTIGGGAAITSTAASKTIVILVTSANTGVKLDEF